jgi:cytochrome b6-f complex iron-sulfur subunit
MERKDFLKKFAIGGSILFTAPMLFTACSDDETPEENETPNPNEILVDLSHADFSALGAVGGYAYKNNIIVFRTGNDTYMALSKLCTHSQCTITYSHSDGDLPCPCHGSRFTTSGAVTNGPAQTNLKSYTVKKDGNTLKLT